MNKYVIWVFGFLLAFSLYASEEKKSSQGQPAKVEEVVVVFKTHFDIGYTDMGSNVVQTYRTTMIDQALDVVDQNRDLPASQQFVWTIPGWARAIPSLVD
jgi:hypothetical protein